MNTKLQFRVLYRQFLFRVFDLEVLSTHAQGDANKLLGQFATLLILASVGASFVVIALANPNASGNSGPLGLVFTMIAQHFVIATTMLVVGLFAVLSWDATFPDRRDVLVLAPLPVRARTMFLAKVAAVASALGLTIVLLHSALGLISPLVFAAYATPAALPALTFDATPAPVAARDIEAVMDRDLTQQLTSGELAPGTGAGLAIGVWKHGERRVFAYGAAKPESLFEIGSISKTFTGLILARMVEAGKVRLDEPVRELLPAGTVAKPPGEEITLLDLVTHHSGLPRMPDNFPPGRSGQPLRRLRTRTALRLREKPRGRKTAGRYFPLQQSWSWTPGAGSGGAIREELSRSSARGDHGSTGHDRHGDHTFRRA